MAPPLLPAELSCKSDSVRLTRVFATVLAGMLNKVSGNEATPPPLPSGAALPVKVAIDDRRLDVVRIGS